MRMRLMLVLCLTVASLSSCIVRAQSDAEKKGQAKKVSAPPLTLKSGANFGNAVELETVTLSSARPQLGQPLTFNLRFKVNQSLETDYVIFVHVEDSAGRVDRLLADHRPKQGAYPTPQWKVGETVDDEFQITVPQNSKMQGLKVFIGLWDPVTDARLPLQNPSEVQNDGQNRVMIASVPFDM